MAHCARSQTHWVGTGWMRPVGGPPFQITMAMKMMVDPLAESARRVIQCLACRTSHIHGVDIISVETSFCTQTFACSMPGVLSLQIWFGSILHGRKPTTATDRLVRKRNHSSVNSTQSSHLVVLQNRHFTRGTAVLYKPGM